MNRYTRSLVATPIPPVSLSVRELDTSGQGSGGEGSGCEPDPSLF
jgi:hypothetical protein